jgi:hypothetical protein
MTQDPTEAGSGSATEQVKEQVAQQAQAAQDKARGAAGQARSRLNQQLDQRSTQAGERLGSTASDVRSVADELRRQGKDGPARMVEQAAAQADRMADYLKAASGERILRDVEDFGRNRPWAVAAGGLALGFVASRLLKASSSRRYHADRVSGGGSHGPARPAAPIGATRMPASSDPIGSEERLPRAQ